LTLIWIVVVLLVSVGAIALWRLFCFATVPATLPYGHGTITACCCRLRMVGRQTAPYCPELEPDIVQTQPDASGVDEILHTLW